MRLIDGDALLEKMKHRRDYVGRPSDAVCLVEDEPSMVMSCKYCKYFTHHTAFGIDTWCNNLGMSRNENFFCADFEKKVGYKNG